MPSDLVDEKRRFQRIIYKAEGVLSGDGVDLPCRVVDLSLKGCLLEFSGPWQGEPSACYRLTLKLSDAVSIEMKLRCIRQEKLLAGFECEHIDIDSMTNLRRLVELNLGDSEVLNRELIALSDF